MANHCRPQPRCERQDPEPQPRRGALGFLQHDEEEQERQPDSRRTGSRSRSARSTKTWLTFHFLLVTSERLLVRITDWRLSGGAWRRRNGYWSNVGRDRRPLQPQVIPSRASPEGWQTAAFL